MKNLRNFMKLLGYQAKDEGRAQGEYSRLLDAIDRIEYSPSAVIFSPEVIDSVKSEIERIRLEEANHERYLTELIAWMEGMK